MLALEDETVMQMANLKTFVKHLPKDGKHGSQVGKKRHLPLYY